MTDTKDNAERGAGAVSVDAVSTGHAGDCTIYAALSSGNASDGICTCGYGAACRGRGDESEMYSAERQADDAAGIAWWNAKTESEREAMLLGLLADPRTALACWEVFGRHSRAVEDSDERNNTRSRRWA